MANQNSQPTYKRQRFLLSLVNQLQNDAHPTDIQKLVFLYEQEQKIDYYEFVPYRYGPYSFQLAEDTNTLCRDGYLIKHQAGIKSIGDYQYDLFSSLPSERGDALKRIAYRKYPYYAINSEIIDRLFRGDEAKRFHKSRDQYRQNEQVLFTIGYEGKSVAVKTYPTISEKYSELVCTAGVLEDGSWIRLYPMPFRLLNDEQKYPKYTWIQVEVEKNRSDFRKESFRPALSSIMVEPKSRKVN